MAIDLEPNGEQGERLTISEAASRLGVSARYVRRLLERPELSAMVEHGTRQTRTGERGTRLVPPALFLRLQSVTTHKLDAEPNEERGPEQNAAEHGTRNEAAESQKAVPFSEPDQLTPLGARLVAEMEGRIMDLQRQLAAANAALEREQQNHARTQALASMPPALTSPEGASRTPVEQPEAEKKRGRGGRGSGGVDSVRGWLEVRLVSV